MTELAALHISVCKPQASSGGFVSMKLPCLYPIVDAGVLAARAIPLKEYAQALRDAGALLLQHRDKRGTSQQILRDAATLKNIFSGNNCVLILNDHADLVTEAEWNGVHLGQHDIPPGAARMMMPAGAIIGVSTHNEARVIAADAGCADYIAIGPVFATSTKDNPDPVIGLDGVRRLRALTKKPLVAIGGITRANCVAVVEAGADSVAVISELLPRAGESTSKVAGDFLRLLG